MTPKELLLKNIEYAALHKTRIVDALAHLEPLMPMTSENFVHLNSNEKAYLDVMAMRFIKLQDTMGAKIFPLTLRIMKENVDTNRFLDVLNLLEKVGVIESKDFWLELREMRNYIAHDYPENDQTTIDAINNLYKSCKAILVFFDDYILKIKEIIDSNKL